MILKGEDMEIEVKYIEDKIAVIKPDEDITFEKIKFFEDCIDQALNKGINNILLNFNRIDYICSNALGLIMLYYKELKNKNGSLKICNVSDKMSGIFKILTIDKIFDKEMFVKSEEEVLNTFFIKE